MNKQINFRHRVLNQHSLSLKYSDMNASIISFRRSLEFWIRVLDKIDVTIL